jgi:outer membrane receptor protein involved in Fe transport
VPNSAKITVRLLGFGLTSSLALIARSAPAVAADASTDSSTLQEVVVTATKLNAAKVLDVPASLQAISGDTLERQGASGIMSIAGQVPGLSIQDLGPGDKKYVIRGLNSVGDSTTGVYFGEAVITQGNGDDGGGFQPDIRLYDMDHVEVLRGPQGTLYGASSMAGTIRFIPKAPVMDKVEGYVNGEDSNTQHGSNNYNVNGALNLPIVDGVLALRLVGWKIYDSGYVDQYRVGVGVTAQSNGVTLPVKALGFLKGINDDDVGGGRAILRWMPMDNLTVDASYIDQSESSNGSSRWTPPGVAAFAGGPIPPINGCDLCNTDVTQSPWTDDLKVFGVVANWKTSLGTVTATNNQFNRTTGFTFDSTPVLVSFDVPVPAETLEPRTRHANTSELRFASDLNSPVNFVAGAYREQSTQDLAVQVITTGGNGLVTGPFSSANADDALNFPGVGNTFFGRTDHRASVQWAGFGEATWKITDALTAIGGIRYFTETLNGFQVQTHPFGGFPPGTPSNVPVFDPQETFNKVTWKGSLSYKFSEQVLAYGLVSTGFRSGGLNAVSEPFEPIPAAYKPDTVINYELGIKGRLWNGLLDYQLDGYFIHWGNMQVQETTADGAFNYIGNVGDSHIKGVEFELNARPFEYFTGTLTGSYQNAKVVSGATPDEYAANQTLCLTGDPIPNVPKFQASLGADYTRPVSANWQVTANTQVTYRDSVQAYCQSNPFNIPLNPYTLWDLRFGGIYKDWTIMVFGRNLTNERAQVSAINSSQDPHALLTVQPRTIGVSFTRKF